MTARPARPPARDIVVIFVLGVAGTLVPVLGWLIGTGLVLRASAWSGSEKAVAIVGPLVVLLAAAALLVTAFGGDLSPLPLLAAVPLTTSLSSAAGAICLALRLVAHRRASGNVR